MTKYIVARADELAPGERMIVELEGRSIGVFNVGGEYYALLDQCPHAGAQLCKYGTVFGIAEAAGPSVADIQYTRRGEMLLCPWHRWEYDIKTGESWFDPSNNRVRSYPVEVVPGAPETVIDLDGGMQKGPHILEGYAVTVDGDNMIVVDTSRRRRGGTQQRPAPPVDTA